MISARRLGQKLRAELDKTPGALQQAGRDTGVGCNIGRALLNPAVNGGAFRRVAAFYGFEPHPTESAMYREVVR